MGHWAWPSASPHRRPLPPKKVATGLGVPMAERKKDEAIEGKKERRLR